MEDGVNMIINRNDIFAEIGATYGKLPCNYPEILRYRYANIPFEGST